MLRRANQTKRQIIEQLNRRVLKETTLPKRFQDEGMGKTPLGEEENPNSRHNKLVGYLQSLISSEGFTVAEIWKAIKHGLTPQIKVNDRYVMGEPDVEYGDEEDERRYDDRENYGTDDESRYDERNYKYGNNPDDDLKEEELPTVRKKERDMLRRKPSAKSRFHAGLGKSL